VILGFVIWQSLGRSNIMVTKHYICDVCDCSEIFDIDDTNYHGWTRFDLFGRKMELCPKCTEKLRLIIEKFFDGEE
jgi:DNA polymerase III alpha subunit (gram-positive type)